MAVATAVDVKAISHVIKAVQHLTQPVMSVTTKAILRMAVVALQTFYLRKLDFLTAHLGKLNFLSVTDFSLGNLPQGNFYCRELRYVSRTKEFLLNATPKR